MPVKTWSERIDEAEWRGAFTQEDRDLSAEWVTCACGQQDPRIPRFPRSFVPQDMVLRDLGGAFCAAVMGNEFRKARRCLVSIERRVSEVLAALPVPA